MFCDDLRDELSGQTTYVGVYGDAIFIDDPLPIRLPQLCMAIHLFDEPRTEPAAITIKIIPPGADIDNPEMSFDITPNFQLLDLPDIGDIPARPRAHVVIKSGAMPYTISKYGRIRIVAMWDGELVPLGSLAIAPSPPEDSRPT